MSRVEAWLKNAGLNNHATAFRDRKIVFNRLGRLTDIELFELGLSTSDQS